MYPTEAKMQRYDNNEKAVGGKPTAQSDTQDYNAVDAQESQESRLANATMPVWPTALKLDPMKLPGIVGDTVRWIVASSYKQQPELALLNTLAVLGAVFGRKYTNHTGIRTNLFCCGIANTGTGKDESRKRLKELMLAAGLETYLGCEDFKSGAGLIKQMEYQPSNVMMIDEFGLVMSSISGKNAPSHQIEIGKQMLTLFTQSGSTYKGGQYASKDQKPITIYDPNLCIYGCTTLEKYLSAIKKDTVESGFLNRFITLEGRSNGTLTKNVGQLSKQIPDDLLIAWKALAAAGIEEANQNVILPKLTVVEWGITQDFVEDLAYMEDKYVEDNRDLGSLFSRYREMILKVAAIFSICDDQRHPVYHVGDIINAERIVYASLEYTLNLCKNHMYESDYERTYNAVRTHIFENAPVSRTELYGKFKRLKKRDLEAILVHLIEAGVISARQILTRGRPTVVYEPVRKGS